jgi:hypothetical protein
MERWGDVASKRTKCKLSSNWPNWPNGIINSLYYDSILKLVWRSGYIGDGQSLVRVMTGHTRRHTV